jgi:hypothetical protein
MKDAFTKICTLFEKLNKLEKITSHMCILQSKNFRRHKKSGSKQGLVRAAKLSIAF